MCWHAPRWIHGKKIFIPSLYFQHMEGGALWETWELWQQVASMRLPSFPPSKIYLRCQIWPVYGFVVQGFFPMCRCGRNKWSALPLIDRHSSNSWIYSESLYICLLRVYKHNLTLKVCLIGSYYYSHTILRFVRLRNVK